MADPFLPPHPETSGKDSDRPKSAGPSRWCGGLVEADARKIYSVSEVTRDIKALLEDNFPALWISGEISNFRQPTSGHFYFTLKDETAQLAAVMFRGANHRLKFQLEDGLEVIVHGRISVYEPRGQYQIVVDLLEPRGVGALQLAFEQLKKKLEEEGLFDKKHKKELPYLPQKIGIVTSPQGAALQDMLNILRRRFPNVNILVNPVRVQGEGAAEEIAEAICEMNHRGDVDLLIVGRGGGSLEDLWAFNEEAVVRAIFDSRLPVISAVGHETDFTLADLAADLRAPTPSAAAELAVPLKEDLLSMIEGHRSGLRFALKQFLDGLKEKLRFLKKQLKAPRDILDDLLLRVAEARDRLTEGLKEIFKENRRHLREMQMKLTAYSPLGPLQRGYSIVFPEGKGEPVRSVHDAKTGDRLEIQFVDGKVSVRVVG